MTSKEKKSFYITTTIPYVNADPHIGFALELVQSDAIARYQRLTGKDVFLAQVRMNMAKKFGRQVKKKEKTSRIMLIFMRKNF